MNQEYREHPFYTECDSKGNHYINTKIGSLPEILDKPFNSLWDAIAAIKAFLVKKN